MEENINTEIINTEDNTLQNPIKKTVVPKKPVAKINTEPVIIDEEVSLEIVASTTTIIETQNNDITELVEITSDEESIKTNKNNLKKLKKMSDKIKEKAKKDKKKEKEKEKKARKKKKDRAKKEKAKNKLKEKKAKKKAADKKKKAKKK